MYAGKHYENDQDQAEVEAWRALPASVQRLAAGKQLVKETLRRLLHTTTTVDELERFLNQAPYPE